MSNKNGITIKCLNCGKEKYVSGCYVSTAKYCSRKCYADINLGKPNKTSFKIGHKALEGTDNPAWKGDAVGYTALHKWVRRHLGVPKICVRCSSDSNVQWANKSQEYHRDLLDWFSLCKKCHVAYDHTMEKAWITRRSYA